MRWLASRRVRLRLGLSVLLTIAGLARAAHADIVVGVAVPVQGTRAETGREILSAARLAAERFNAVGGVLGEHVTVISADDGCQADKAEAAAKSLVEQGARLVVGHPCAAAAVAAAKVYAQSATLFIAPATRHPALTAPRAGPTIFRLSGRDDRQGAAAGAYLARKFASKPIAIVRDASLYAKKLSDGALAALRQAGRTDVTTATIAGAQKDYGSLIAKLAQVNVSAVFFTGFPLEGALLLRQMRARGLRSLFLGGDALAAPQFAETAGDAAEGVGVLLPADPSRTLDEKARRNFPGANPVGPFLTAYAAMESWKAAATAARSLEGSAVAGILQQGRTDTVLGPVKFDPDGNADLPAYDIVWWRRGAWRR
jgi:branched-chain amino acid transport system substrate-binding protein